MSVKLKKPKILRIDLVARSRLFIVESVDLAFSNGARRIYERMRSSKRESVMVVPIISNHLLLIKEYVVGLETYELGFPKGMIDPSETIFEAANRELKEETGFGANMMESLSKITMVPSYFSSKMNILIAEDLYLEKLEGDEPEAMVVIRWPLEKMMTLLQEPEFNEARNVSALFLAREWLVKKRRLIY